MRLKVTSPSISHYPIQSGYVKTVLLSSRAKGLGTDAKNNSGHKKSIYDIKYYSQVPYT